MAKIRLQKIYRCDPLKNVTCTRTGCAFVNRYCYATTNKEYAMINPETGKPELLPEFNVIEFER